MAYVEGQLDGTADFYVGINVWHMEFDRPGNRSRFGWEVHLRTPRQYGTYDASSEQSWWANIGGIPLAGKWVLLESERWNNHRIIASGSVWVSHDAEGFRPGFASSATLSTNHSSVGSGGSGNAWVDAPRIAKKPTAPRNVRVADSKPTTLSIAWDAPADTRGAALTEYLVRYAPASPADALPYTDVTVNASTLQATFGNLRPGTPYFVVVYAKNGATWDNAGYSPKSAQLAARTLSGVYVWSGSEWRPAELLTYTATGWKSGEVRTYQTTGWKEAA